MSPPPKNRHQWRHRQVALIAVTALCLMPGALNLAGIDFGSATMRPGSPASAFEMSPGAIHHALLEWTAVVIAMSAALVSLVHFRNRRDLAVPIMGIALLTAGAVDAFHSLAAMRIIRSAAPDSGFVPFTWALSRIFHSSALLFGATLSLWLGRLTRNDATPTRPVHAEGRALGLIAAGFALVAYAAVHLSASSPSLPQTLYPRALISRPFDVVPLALFLCAGAVFWSWHSRSPSTISFTLMLSTIPEVATQVHMAFGSQALFDNHFNIAHALKVVAYGCMLVGLLQDLSGPVRVQAGAPAVDNETQPLRGPRPTDPITVGQATRPLSAQIPLAAFVLAFAISLTIALAMYSESLRLIHQTEADKIQSKSHLLQPVLVRLYRQAQEDATFLRRTPPIQGIASAVREGDAKNDALWRGRLQQIFTEILHGRSAYVSIRYMAAAGTGNDLVHVYRSKGDILTLPEGQRRPVEGTRPTDALKQGRSAITFSRVTSSIIPIAT